MLERFGMQDWKPCKPPAAVYFKKGCLSAGESLSEEDTRTYQSIIGSLMYAMIGTRPDIAFFERTLEVCIETWQESSYCCWKCFKIPSIFKRLTSEVFSRGCQEDGSSGIGFVFKVLNGPVSWYAKKQSTIALSTAEAECFALSHAIQKAIGLRHLLKDLGYLQLEASCHVWRSQAHWLPYWANACRCTEQSGSVEDQASGAPLVLKQAHASWTQAQVSGSITEGQEEKMVVDCWCCFSAVSSSLTPPSPTHSHLLLLSLRSFCLLSPINLLNSWPKSWLTLKCESGLLTDNPPQEASLPEAALTKSASWFEPGTLWPSTYRFISRSQSNFALTSSKSRSIWWIMASPLQGAHPEAHYQRQAASDIHLCVLLWAPCGPTFQLLCRSSRQGSLSNPRSLYLPRLALPNQLGPDHLQLLWNIRPQFHHLWTQSCCTPNLVLSGGSTLGRSRVSKTSSQPLSGPQVQADDGFKQWAYRCLTSSQVSQSSL